MATGTRTTYTDTTPQKRSIADMIGMIDWTEAPLLKLLGLDSGLSARKELAAALGYAGNDEPGSAAWNIWLHKQVIARIRADGGQIRDLTD